MLHGQKLKSTPHQLRLASTQQQTHIELGSSHVAIAGWLVPSIQRQSRLLQSRSNLPDSPTALILRPALPAAAGSLLQRLHQSKSGSAGRGRMTPASSCSARLVMHAFFQCGFWQACGKGGDGHSGVPCTAVVWQFVSRTLHTATPRPGPTPIQL